MLKDWGMSKSGIERIFSVQIFCKTSLIVRLVNLKRLFELFLMINRITYIYLGVLVRLPIPFLKATFLLFGQPRVSA